MNNVPENKNTPSVNNKEENPVNSEETSMAMASGSISPQLSDEYSEDDRPLLYVVDNEDYLSMHDPRTRISDEAVAAMKGHPDDESKKKIYRDLLKESGILTDVSITSKDPIKR